VSKIPGEDGYVDWDSQVLRFDVGQKGRDDLGLIGAGGLLGMEVRDVKDPHGVMLTVAMDMSATRV
jgi:hypothetical protein